MWSNCLLTIIFIVTVTPKSIPKIKDNANPPPRITLGNRYDNCLRQIQNKSNTVHITSPTKDYPDVIILVDSKVGDFVSRCAIRAVWSHLSNKIESSPLTYVVNFQLGYTNNKTLESALYENSLYNDLFIHNSIQEHYRNVGKKLIASLEFINEFLNSSPNNNLKFIVKTDDDVYVNIKSYMLHLNNIISSKIDYEGLLYKNMPVIRDERHKNYEPFSTIKEKIFPPYCSGGGYVIRATKLQCLVRVSGEQINLQNGDANIGHLLRFCNTTFVGDNEIYGAKSIYNFNLSGALDLIRKKVSFYFMHGIRGTDQLIMDAYFEYGFAR